MITMRATIPGPECCRSLWMKFMLIKVSFITFLLFHVFMLTDVHATSFLTVGSAEA